MHVLFSARGNSRRTRTDAAPGTQRPLLFKAGAVFFAQRGARAYPAGSPTCAGLPRPPGRARRHAPVLPRQSGRPADMRRSCRARPAALADMRRFAAPARPARHNAPVSHTRPAAPRPPAGLCLSPWKAEKYAPAKYIYKRAAALQPGRSDCNGHFLETSLQIQLAVV